MSCHSTHVGIAATQHAKAITNLDDAQVSSIFHRLKKAHAHAPAPTHDEAIAVLTRLRREALEDTRLDEPTAYRLAARYDKAITAANDGTLPDGRTWAAMQHTALEAEIAEKNLTRLLRTSAREQRKSEERLAATFRKWRRTDDYEDLEAPDPTFRPNLDDYPCDKHTARALRKLGFENYLAQRLPCFVYGTLRRGQGNEHVMGQAIADRSETAHIDGIAVYGADRGFPYAQEAPDGNGVTRGDLVWLSEDHDGDWARQSLDRLEGFNSDHFSTSHYRRVERQVTYTDPDTGQPRTVRAWVYLAGDRVRATLSEQDRIPHGDWVQARTDYRGYGGYGTGRGHRRFADVPDDDTADDSATESMYDGPITYVKRATDPTPAASGAPAAGSAVGSAVGSAADAAAVFEAAGLLDT